MLMIQTGKGEGLIFTGDDAAIPVTWIRDEGGQVVSAMIAGELLEGEYAVAFVRRMRAASGLEK